MKRAWYFPRRMMPSNVLKRDLRSVSSLCSPSRLAKKARTNSYSTSHQERLWNNDPIHPAILAGGSAKRGGHANKASSHKTSFSPSKNTLPEWRAQPSKRKRLNKATTQKSSHAPSAPRARSAHRGTSSQLIDETYIRQKYQIPTAADYPGAPSTLDTQPKSAIHNGSKQTLIPKTIYSQKPNGVCTCTLVCEIPGHETFTLVGEGLAKKSAEKAAWLIFLAKLHELGILKDIFFKDDQDVISKETLQDEADAKTDIYNYAARFGSLPRFSQRVISRPFRARARQVTEVTIELSEPSIKVTARGQNLYAAEIAAAIRFKEEAERYHAQQGGGSIIIKDSEALNVENVRSFIEFFKLSNKSAKFTTDAKEMQATSSYGSRPWKVQILKSGEPIGEAITMRSKKKAEDVACLSAALALQKEKPDLFPQFQRALKAGNGAILRPVVPIDMPIDTDCVLVMRETLHAARRAGLPDEQDDVMSEPEIESFKRAHSYTTLSPDELRSKSENLSYQLRAYRNTPILEELRRKRADLPMNQYRRDVVEQVDNNVYSIIVGATGSGKTTQVPQIILEDAIDKGCGASCNVICTQPRRIAATSVARRVAQERDEPLQKTIGYHVRFDAKLPEPGGSITYCTTGILLQKLQHTPDEVFDSASHLIIDEVHERDMITDFLLIILKKVMGDRIKSQKTVPKVVLMSATMDTELFAGYFKGQGRAGSSNQCPSLSVPGRTFPVKENYLEGIVSVLQGKYSPQQLSLLSSDPLTREYLKVDSDFVRTSQPATRRLIGDETSLDNAETIIEWKRERIAMSKEGVPVANQVEDALVPLGLVATTIAHIAKTSNEGAILVFLPGLDEILKVDEMLRRQQPLGLRFEDQTKFKLSMLHSSIQTGQTDVFNPVPSGCRKIILATNIAETSITIPDVQYVVDTGKLREKQYDQVRRITRLACTWISKSNSKQRAGRAGRVQNGNYYALFSKARFDSLRAIGLPEMLRSDLQEISLDIKAQAFKAPIREFLSEAIEPPPPVAVDISVQNLQSLKALTDEEEITPLGRVLSSMPVHPALGKMIVLGIVFRCLDPMLILASSSVERGLFVTPLDARRQAEEARLGFVEGTGSDHIAQINAFRELRQIRMQRNEHESFMYAREKFLHFGAFKTIDQTARQIEDILVEAGLIPPTPPHRRNGFQLGAPSLNENSFKVPLIKALAVAGLHPNVAVNSGGRSFRTYGEKGVMVHPASINHPRGRADEKLHDFGTLFTYSTMAKSNDGNTMFLRDTSLITPLMATLFGGKLKSKSNVLEMDGWLPFFVKGDFEALRTVLEFRKALDRLMTGAFQDLSKRKSAGKGFLADEEARAIFASGLVAVFDRDVKVKEQVASRGWSSRERNGFDRGRSPFGLLP